MNKIRYQASLICAFVICFFMISCDDDKEWHSNVYEFKVELEEGTVMQNKPFVFTDLSVGIKSRTWEFEDGVPATSNAPVVSVNFTKHGVKKWTLHLLYDNGETESRTMEIDVKEPLIATMNIDKLTPLGCLPLNENIQFSLDIEGSYTSIEWIFENGSVGTSADIDPIVKFTKEGPIKVSVKVYRESDGASSKFEKEINIGHYPMLVAYTKADMDSWSFDKGKSIGKWTVYNAVDGVDEVGKGKALRVANGSNNTPYCMQINYNKAAQHWQFFTRDNWVNNAQLEKGKKYEFKFWMKGDKNFFLNDVMLVNNLPEWSWNELLGALASSSWGNYYPNIPFETQNETYIMYDVNVPVYTNWREYRYEFTVGDKDLLGATLPNKLLNVFPSFSVNSDQPSQIYIDGIMINLIEE